MRRQLYIDYGEKVDGETISLTCLELCDGFVFANIPYDNAGKITYIVEGAVDWTYIDSLLDFDMPNPDLAPYPSDMLVSVTGKTAYNLGETLTTAKRIITYTDAEGKWLVEYDGDGHQTERYLAEPVESTEATRIFYDSFAGIGGCFGVEVDEAQLSFSYEPTDYSVSVENWDRSESYTLHASELQDHLLPLAPYSAHYIVQGDFDTVRNTHYEMAFYFDIGQPVDAELWETP